MPFINTEAQWHADGGGRGKGTSGLDSLSIHFLKVMMRINFDEVYVKKYIQWLLWKMPGSTA